MFTAMMMLMKNSTTQNPNRSNPLEIVPAKKPFGKERKVQRVKSGNPIGDGEKRHQVFRSTKFFEEDRVQTPKTA